MTKYVIVSFIVICFLIPLLKRLADKFNKRFG